MLVPEAHEKFYLNATQLRASTVAPGGLRGACGRLEADGRRRWHNAPGWAGAGGQVRRSGVGEPVGARARGAGCARGERARGLPCGRAAEGGGRVSVLARSRPGPRVLRSSHLLWSVLSAGFFSFSFCEGGTLVFLLQILSRTCLLLKVPTFKVPKEKKVSGWWETTCNSHWVVFLTLTW